MIISLNEFRRINENADNEDAKYSRIWNDLSPKNRIKVKQDVFPKNNATMWLLKANFDQIKDAGYSVAVIDSLKKLGLDINPLDESASGEDDREELTKEQYAVLYLLARSKREKDPIKFDFNLDDGQNPIYVQIGMKYMTYDHRMRDLTIKFEGGFDENNMAPGKRHFYKKVNGWFSEFEKMAATEAGEEELEKIADGAFTKENMQKGLDFQVIAKQKSDSDKQNKAHEYAIGKALIRDLYDKAKTGPPSSWAPATIKQQFLKLTKDKDKQGPPFPFNKAWKEVMDEVRKEQGVLENAANDSTGYYRDQLDRINLDSEYQPRFKLSSPEGGRDTNYMGLNKQSATVLIKWLQDNMEKFYDTI